MTDLLVIIAAVLIAIRLVGPVLRVLIGLLVSLLGAVVLVALAIIVLVGVLTHGTLI